MCQHHYGTGQSSLCTEHTNLREDPMSMRVRMGLVLWLPLWVASTMALGQSTSPFLELEQRVIDIYETVGPSVVNITSLAYTYDWFLGSVPQEGTGSGFVYDDAGHIVTNYHVVEHAVEIIGTLTTGDEYSAELVGVDPSSDLAVLRIDAGTSLPEPLTLSDSDLLRVGQFVAAIGTPFGLDQTLTTGVVSALERVIESAEVDQFIGGAIQTDAAINPGNSGGPLLNLSGEVIGVNSQILSTSGSSAGIGFAISSNTVKHIVPELIDLGRYRHPWIGLQTVDLNAYTVAILREAGMELSVDAGVLVVGFDDGSPARDAGLSNGDRVVRIGRYAIPIGGDIIVAVDDVSVETMANLTVYLEAETRIGDSVTLSVLRNGRLRKIRSPIGENPGDS